MSKQETVLRVFVASPQELKQERDALENAIRELNTTWSQTLGVRLDLVMWETHAYPGIGADAQDVINTQIGDDYDIFIGILFTRFGTPTQRAASGTAEEFERAYDRFKRDPNSIRVMFYFKDSDIKPSEIDLDQYAAVKQFQLSIGEKGTLYWSFLTTDEFVQLVRMHLSRQAQDLGKGWGLDLEKSSAGPSSKTREAPEVPAQTSAEPEEEDEGFLDLIEIGEENISNMATSIQHMTEAITELGAQMGQKTAEINNATETKDWKHAKKVTNSIANSMQQYADRMEAELPIYRTSYTTGMDATTRAAALVLSDFKTNDALEQLIAVQTPIETLSNAISQGRVTIGEMKQSIVRMPRATTEFNHAKKRVLKVLTELETEMEGAHNLTSETSKELKHIIERLEAGNEVIITEHGTPVARLVPVVAHSKKKRVAGLNRGTISTSEDFDEPLPDEFWLGRE